MVSRYCPKSGGGASYNPRPWTGNAGVSHDAVSLEARLISSSCGRRVVRAARRRAFARRATGQSRTVTDGVYSDAQAARGQQLYKAQCVTCHGETLEGVVGPPLTGNSFLAVWGCRSLADLVDKIQKTMPPAGSPALCLGSRRSIWRRTCSSAGNFPAGQTELRLRCWDRLRFRQRASPCDASGGASSFAVAGNLAQLMRGVTFPNANILFNVQVKDPGKEKPAMPVPFDYVLWGSTCTTAGRRSIRRRSRSSRRPPSSCCPDDDARTEGRSRRSRRLEAVHGGAHGRRREAYRAAQTRNVDAVVKIADQLNESCANCHKVYRDGAQEGTALAPPVPVRRIEWRASTGRRSLTSALWNRLAVW